MIRKLRKKTKKFIISAGYKEIDKFNISQTRTLMALFAAKILKEKKSKVNIIIYSDNGILDDPIVIKNKKAIKQTFLNLAAQTLGPEINKVTLDPDNYMEEINDILKYKGKEIICFTDIEIE